MQDKKASQKNVFLRKALFWILPPMFIVIFGLFLFWPMILIIDSATFALAISKETARFAIILIRAKEAILIFISIARTYFAYILWLVSGVFLFRSLYSALTYRKRKEAGVPAKELLEFCVAVMLFYFVFGILAYSLVNIENIFFS